MALLGKAGGFVVLGQSLWVYKPAISADMLHYRHPMYRSDGAQRRGSEALWVPCCTVLEERLEVQLLCMVVLQTCA